MILSFFCTGTDFASVYQGANADLAVSGWFGCNGLAVDSDSWVILRLTLPIILTVMRLALWIRLSY